MPAMWLHWQEFITGISLMRPSGGGAHVHIILSYSCAGFTSTQLWGITRQMDNTHFSCRRQQWRKITGRGTSDDFTAPPEGLELSLFWRAWHDLLVWDTALVQSGRVERATTGGVGCPLAAQLPVGLGRSGVWVPYQRFAHAGDSNYPSEKQAGLASLS